MTTARLRARITRACGGTALSLATAGLTVGCGSNGSGAKDGGAPPASTEPWAAELARNDGVTQKSRQCVPMDAITRARKAETASSTCPTQAEIVSLGLVSLPPPPPPGQVAMTGTNLVDGPASWKGDCCYLLSHWKTGRPLLVAGRARHADLTRAAPWSALAREEVLPRSAVSTPS